MTTTTEKDKFHSLYFHKLGTPEEEDVLVADFRENEDFMWYAVELSHPSLI